MKSVCNGCGENAEIPNGEEYCDECAGINRRIPPKLMSRIALLEKTIRELKGDCDRCRTCMISRIKKIEDNITGIEISTDTVDLGPKARLK